MFTHRAGTGAGLVVLTAAVTVALAPVGTAQTVPQARASPVAGLTGTQSTNETEARYQVKGTDLGIMWTDERGQILTAFGTEWKGSTPNPADPATIDWRSNT